MILTHSLMLLSWLAAAFRRLFRVGSFDLGLNQALKRIVYVPAPTKPLTLPQLNDDLIGCRSTQSKDIDPSYSGEQFSYLSISLFIALLIRFTGKRPPECTIRSSQMLLNSSSTYS